MERQSFLQGALILVLAGIITRILGFVLRIILVKVVGDEGLGLFQMVYPVYITLLLISTAGFPLAISKIIPERLTNNNYRGAIHLLKVTLITVFFLSSIIAAFVYLTSGQIANIIFNDPRTNLIFLALTPALIICPLASSFKGFFQGLHTMLPTAMSQITEQVTRLLATLTIISMVSFMGLKFQAAGIALGISIGEFSSLILLSVMFISHLRNWKQKNKLNKQKPGFFHDVLQIGKIGIPVTAGRIINSLMMSGEAILIPRQLKLSGQTIQEATSLYGQFSGMAIQLLLLPTVFTIALTTSLIPDISEAYSRNNMKKIKNNYQDVLRITTYLGFPITVIFIIRGQEICQFLFSYPEAGKILALIAYSATFIYYIQVSSGMLNGLGKPKLALRNLSIGSATKLLMIFYLVRDPRLGIVGAALAMIGGYGLSAILNYISIGNIIGFVIDYKQVFLKPFLCSAIIYLINPYLTSLLRNYNFYLRIIIILICSVLVYLIFMILLRAITSKDIKRFKP